uniref:ABC transporter substrate-binding protein n=1 Tax=Ramlibacter sp. TaxID=1917967 RepID=UPI00183497CF
GAAVARPALAQPGNSRALAIAQIHDSSPAQQDVSKDFLIGSRAAWQDINTKGGVRGRPVQHLAIEVNGTAAGVRSAIVQVRDNPSCVALSGTCGDPAATAVLQALRQENLGIAHVAPWLQNSSVELDDRTFAIFAARQEQVAHAMKSLAAMGMQEVGAVYASGVEESLYHADVQRIATELRLTLRAWRGEGDLVQLGRRLGAASPAILLFVGGTPELVQLTQGLDRQQRQRYVVALADVNLQTMMQMGAARHTPVIATQAVPMVTAGLPVVRAYRDTLARLFDEPPTPLGLAGFIAARCTYEVLAEIEGAPTRATVLATFQRRAGVELGGYRVTFDPRRRAAAYVTQSMLTQDGRVVG